MQVEFDWDPVKAASNLAKHGVSFEEAMAVFADPLALSRLDENHGATEERWVTMGEARGRLLLAVHTYVELGRGACLRSHYFCQCFRQARNEAISGRRDTMKDGYDFSGAARGQFYHADAKLIPPVHLEPDVLDYLAARAVARGTSLSSLVNGLLKKDIELIETGK